MAADNSKKGKNLRAVIGVLALGLAGMASADSQELEYSSSLAGSMTYLSAGDNALDGRATYATANTTGTLDVSLTYTAGKLVDYDISVYLSNGASITQIGTDSFFVPSFVTSTGAATCASHTEISGCITLNGSSAIINFVTSTTKGGSFAVSAGPAGDSFNASLYMCNVNGPSYPGNVTNSQHLCSVGLTGSGGRWSSTTIAAPELDGAGMTGALTLASAALIMLSYGRRRQILRD